MPRHIKHVFVLPLVALLWTACQPVSTLPLPTPLPSTATAVPSPTLTPFQPATVTPTLTPTATVRPVAMRVLIISIDGLRPDTVVQAPMPILTGLMQGGAYTLSAQTTLPAETLPAHASMLTGMCPSQHGVTWNTYTPSKGYARGVDIFDLAQELGLQTVMVVSKDKLRQITEPKSTDVFRFVSGSDEAVAKQAAALITQGFDLMFVHLDDLDVAGHEYDWSSPKYLQAAQRADAALATLLTALEGTGLRDETLVFVTTDHAGVGENHLGSDPQITTIPWVVSGVGVKPQFLTEPVSVVDTVATAAWIMNIPIPLEWDGIPVFEAFAYPVEPRPEPRCP